MTEPKQSMFVTGYKTILEDVMPGITEFKVETVDNIIKKLPEDQQGLVSDGFHSFDDLYMHRMFLTYMLCKAKPEMSWKSKQHFDDSIFPGYFIVGFNTPEGTYSYHYELKYWDLFDGVNEVDRAPEYDGHKPEDFARLLSMFD